MKNLFSTLLLATLGATASKAGIVLDLPNQIGFPGQTLPFFGTITNTGSTTLFLNSDDLTLAGLSFTINDLFFANVPLSLAPAGQPGSSSGDIELFDILVSNSLLDAPAKYFGAYTLVGGAREDAQEVLFSTAFSVTTTPEPSTIGLLLGGLSGAFLLARRKQRRA